MFPSVVAENPLNILSKVGLDCATCKPLGLLAVNLVGKEGKVILTCPSMLLLFP
jgi:hypothetical protein